MKIIVLVFAPLILLACGCQTNRSVNLVAPRIDIAGSSTNGLTSAEALAIFQAVAGQRGLLIKGPIQVARDRYEYATTTPSETYLTLWVDDSTVEFEVSIYGRSKEISKAFGVAQLFKDELDQRHVPYKVRTWVAIPPP